VISGEVDRKRRSTLSEGLTVKQGRVIEKTKIPVTTSEYEKRISSQCGLEEMVGGRRAIVNRRHQ